MFILFWAGFATLILFVFGFGFLDMVVLEAGTLIVVVTFDVLDDDFLVEDSGADGLAFDGTSGALKINTAWTATGTTSVLSSQRGFIDF